MQFRRFAICWDAADRGEYLELNGSELDAYLAGLTASGEYGGGVAIDSGCSGKGGIILSHLR